MSVAKKIFEIKKELSSIYRNADGYKFKYPTLTTIKDEIDPKLEANNLVIIPSVIEIVDNVYTFNVDVIDITDDETLNLIFTVKGDTQQQNGVQSSGATMSYMQRYIPKLLFDLDFIDDDPDHKKNSTPKASKPKSNKRQLVDKLTDYVQMNSIDVDFVKTTIQEVSGNSKATSKDLTEKQLLEVIAKVKK